MIEKVVTFGTNKELTGILSLPDRSSEIGSNISIVFLNAGLIHRCGSFRLHTDLARKLAIIGYPSLRFDLHGIGDSSSIQSSLPTESVFQHDIREASDFIINETGIAHIVFFGLCSGADQSHFSAVQDDRIIGSILIDGFAYRTFKFYYYDYIPGLLNFKRYPEIIQKKINSFIQIFSKNKESPFTVPEYPEIYVRNFPPKTKIQSEIQSLVKRGVKLLFVYSGGMPRYYNHNNQFKDMFSSINYSNNITFRYIKEANHTFTSIVLRNILFKMVISWLTDNFS